VPEVPTWTDWSVAALLPRRGVAVLAGPPRASKKMLALQLALSVADASSAADGSAASCAGPVLFVETEHSASGLRGRLAKLLPALGIQTPRHAVQFVLPDAAHPLRLGTGGWAEFDALCASSAPALVVFDGLSALVAGEPAGADLRAVSEALHRLAVRHDCLVLVVQELAETATDDAVNRSLRARDGAPAGGDSELWLTVASVLGKFVRLTAASVSGEQTIWLERDPVSLACRPAGDALVASRLSLVGTIAAHGVASGRVRPTFAPSYVRRLERSLRHFAATDKPDLLLSGSRVRALLDDTDAMGLTPVTDPESLALLGSALGLDDPVSLVRLAWAVNRSKVRTLAAAADRWGAMAKEALRLMGRVPGEPTTEPSAVGLSVAAKDDGQEAAR
jgi:KaiC/GvpD/RAD55 family RecA-like ATPase